MTQIVLIGADSPAADPPATDPRTVALTAALRARHGDACVTIESGDRDDLADRLHTVAIYVAASRGDVESDLPDPIDARRCLERCAAAGVDHVIVIASAAIAVPNHHHPGMVEEDDRVFTTAACPNQVAVAWRDLEAAIDAGARVLDVGITILRPAATPIAGGRDLWSRLLASRRRFAVVPAGFDPTIQLLDINDLANAIGSVIAQPPPPGESPPRFHVVPEAPVLLTSALRLAGVRRLPVPTPFARLHWRRRSTSPDVVDYLCHAATVSGARAARNLGFTAVESSALVARALRSHPVPSSDVDREVSVPARAASDDFGMDERFIRTVESTVGGFLHDRYWRVELTGLEHLPARGRAILVGVHRGFMPFDGVMAVIAARRAVGRTPRFLIHPSLVKFPFLAPAMIKLGGLLANRPNADWVLAGDEILAIFPEGIRGAFSYYRDAYRLKRFGRNEYVKIALANGAPIVPFVTLGSAEIFPILAKLRWRWWRRLSEWPCLPITPTFPILPIPLPSKWHTRFLEPIDVAARYGPDSAEDPAAVRAVGDEVRSQIERTLVDMQAARRSIFFGTIFPATAR